MPNKLRRAAVTQRKYPDPGQPGGAGQTPPGGAAAAAAAAASQPLPVVISPRLRVRQPLITRLLMRPAAVCNHPGPRRAGAGVVGRRQAEEGAEV